MKNVTRPGLPGKPGLHAVPGGKDDGVTASETDAANAEALVRRFGDDLLFVIEWRQWMVWDGRRYSPDRQGARAHRFAVLTARHMMQEALVQLAAANRLPEGDAKKKALGRANAAVAWAKKSQNADRIRAMLDLAHSDPKLLVSYKSLDVDPYLINTRNGTIDLRTGVLRGHKRADRITKLAPCDYAVGAKSPTWGKFLRDVLPRDEVRSFLRRFAGYCLTGDVSERVWVVLYGYGRNGKSVLLRVLLEILGDYACTTSPALLMAKTLDDHPTDVADLFGVRCAVSSEVKRGKAFDEEKVKRLTGDDKLKARKMREDFWEFEPTHKLLLAMNHKLRVRDVTDSFWDRLALVEFAKRIGDSQVDKKLRQKLLAESSGILAWMVQGAIEWQRDGLQVPAVVRDATAQYRNEEDRLGQFFEECCGFGPHTNDWFEYTADLTAAYKTWCDQHGLFSEGGNAVAQRLSEKGCAQKRKKDGAGWLGVRLRVNLEDDGRGGLTPKKKATKKGEPGEPDEPNFGVIRPKGPRPPLSCATSKAGSPASPPSPGRGRR